MPEKSRLINTSMVKLNSFLTNQYDVTENSSMGYKIKRSALDYLFFVGSKSWTPSSMVQIRSLRETDLDIIQSSPCHGVLWCSCLQENNQIISYYSLQASRYCARMSSTVHECQISCADGIFKCTCKKQGNDLVREATTSELYWLKSNISQKEMQLFCKGKACMYGQTIAPLPHRTLTILV